MLSTGVTLQRMLNSSKALYEELFANEPIDAEWQQSGILYPFRHEAGMEHFAENDKLLREHFNHGADRYDGDEVAKLPPGKLLTEGAAS